MLKSILLVLDDQGVDHGSVDMAIRWAVEFDALLVGLGVIDEDAVRPAEPVPLGAGQAKRELDAHRLHQRQVAVGSMLSAIALRCADSRVAFKPLECIGRPAEEIGVEAQRFDLILMARQLQRPDMPGEWAISDTLRTILRSAPRPVVAIPELAPTGNGIVVAYDGSLQAARTLFAFEASSLAARHPVHIISINDDPLEAARRGNRAVEFLGTRGVRSTLSAETTVHPSEQILDFASEVDAGLIVLGAYGKSRIHEFFLGSVTSAVLAKCPLSLFLFH